MNGLTYPAPLRECFADVYEPAEDSFFLLDILESDLFSCGGSTGGDQKEENEPNIGIAVEVCCGSGIATINLARRIPNCCFFCTDINPAACILTSDVARLSGCSHNVYAVQTDLTTSIDGRLAKSVDLLYCNPPYVPTDAEEEADRSLIGFSWAGGKDGAELVVNRFLPIVDTLLSSNGAAYLLMLDKNGPNELISTAKSSFSLKAKMLSTRRFFNEKLSVVKFWR